MLGSLILYLKGMRRMMLKLSGFYYRWKGIGFIETPVRGESLVYMVQRC